MSAFKGVFEQSTLMWVVAIELIVVLTAGIFFPIAKLIGRSDPLDPMVRFWRVFWRVLLRFGVPPPSTLVDKTQPVNATFVPNLAEPTTIDAPDLGGIAEGGIPGLEPLPDSARDPEGEPQTIRAIGSGAAPSGGRIAGAPSAGPGASSASPRQPTPSWPPPKPTEPASRDDDPLDLGWLDAPITEADAARLERKREKERAAAEDDLIKIEAPSGRGTGGGAGSRGKNVPTAGSAPSRRGTVDILLLPNSGRVAVRGISSGELQIEVTHGPDDWSVNGVIIDLIAKSVGVQAYQVTLIRGHNRIRKTLQVAGLDQDEVNARIARLTSPA